MEQASGGVARVKAALARHPKWKTWTVAVALAAIFFVLFIVLLIRAASSAPVPTGVEPGQVASAGEEAGAAAGAGEGPVTEAGVAPPEGAGILGGATVPSSDGSSGASGKGAPEGDASVAETPSQESAFMTAKLHITEMPFSHAGLVAQLESDGFSHEDAVYAVDKLNMDWDAKAVEMAAQYVDTMEFTRADLVDQLMYEGFTGPQAEAAATAVGL